VLSKSWPRRAIRMSLSRILILTKRSCSLSSFSVRQARTERRRGLRGQAAFVGELAYLSSWRELLWEERIGETSRHENQSSWVPVTHFITSTEFQTNSLEPTLRGSRSIILSWT